VAVSYDRIERQNGLAAKLLKLWAYFDRQDVWFELLRHGRLVDSGWIAQLTEDELSFNKAVRVLCSYGLIDPEISSHEQLGSRGYSMHNCIHAWSLSVLNKEWDDDMARLALHCTGSEVPQQDAEKWWIVHRRLLPHAIKVTYFVMNNLVRIEGMEQNVGALASLYREQESLSESEKMYGLVLGGYEKVFGPMHALTLQTLNSLGILYDKQGKLLEAEKMYIRVLRGSEEALISKHILTLHALNNLGIVYRKQGNILDAGKMYRWALEGKEEVFGLNHTSTLDTVNNLAILYVDQGNVLEAEKMYRRALEGKEEALGPMHLSTLQTVNNLGALYTKQGNLLEAEKMYRRALEGKEKALGPKHTSTLDTVNNLGRLYIKQNKLSEAEGMFAWALQGYEEALGPMLLPSYIPALNTMFNMGLLHSTRHDTVMARMMYTKALSGFASVQGSTSEVCRDIQRRLAALDVLSSPQDLDEMTPRAPGRDKFVSGVREVIGKRKRAAT
jgi:tetratricopeptide (TPR) repeat protein